jgi:hypothetical protein
VCPCGSGEVNTFVTHNAPVTRFYDSFSQCVLLMHYVYAKDKFSRNTSYFLAIIASRAPI